jgi:acetoin:2,6-dichlorophenolindophenol oxidoreductase subunit alpha
MTEFLVAGPAGAADTAEDADLELLLLIRQFELKLLELYAQGELNGTTHTCLGQEYIPVAIDPLLYKGDFVFSNHRGHGHYLARHRDPFGLLAEIMGREGALCGGIGGSQHLFRDGYLSTGVQGESMPVAAGVALHLKRNRPGLLACAYIGDGTWGEGAVYEALNMAALWRLPLVVIVENNAIAQSTPTERQLAGDIAGRAAAFGAGYQWIESREIGEIRTMLRPRFAAIRDQGGPLVVEFSTDRLGPHSKGDDTRAPELVARLRERDWYEAYRQADPERLARLEAAARERVTAIAREVIARPLSSGGYAAAPR